MVKGALKVLCNFPFPKPERYYIKVVNCIINMLRGIFLHSCACANSLVFWKYVKNKGRVVLYTFQQQLFSILQLSNIQNLLQNIFESSHHQWKKVFLEISQNLQENTYARISYLMKCLWHRCFPVNFAKFLRTPVLQNIPGRLLLYLLSYKSHRLHQPKFWKALTMFYSTKDNKNFNSPTANFVFTGCWIVRLFLLLKSDNFPMAIYMAS